jgi:ankyrin repeat protein
MIDSAFDVMDQIQLDEFAYVSKQGGSHRHTALHYAARFGHVASIETLIKARAGCWPLSQGRRDLLEQ